MDPLKVTLTDEQGDQVHGLWRYEASDLPPTVQVGSTRWAVDIWVREGWTVSFDDPA